MAVCRIACKFSGSPAVELRAERIYTGFAIRPQIGTPFTGSAAVFFKDAAEGIAADRGWLCSFVS